MSLKSILIIIIIIIVYYARSSKEQMNTKMQTQTHKNLHKNNKTMVVKKRI